VDELVTENILRHIHWPAIIKQYEFITERGYKIFVLIHSVLDIFLNSGCALWYSFIFNLFYKSFNHK
jgi:hypothetical protein